ncbi:hypothetical protein ACFQBQ_11400 [Granulicella cerasi]|uniref:Phage tail protein n=1 Tax=Granulicella cerasi TaxID=741063 RepID=A0ABW1ZAF2_9BACT|nr:hypothetical protein [Granulicella cerasi]
MNAEANARAADALLRVNGGQRVSLRVPMTAVAGDADEELGYATPAFQDVALEPAVFRKSAETTALMVSANAVARAAGEAGAESATAMFATALGVVVGDVLYAVTSCKAGQAMGSAYCYVLGLRETRS